MALMPLLQGLLYLTMRGHRRQAGYRGADLRKDLSYGKSTVKVQGSKFQGGVGRESETHPAFRLLKISKPEHAESWRPRTAL
jgi:hypothetical protein